MKKPFKAWQSMGLALASLSLCICVFFAKLPDEKQTVFILPDNTLADLNASSPLFAGYSKTDWQTFWKKQTWRKLSPLQQDAKFRVYKTFQMNQCPAQAEQYHQNKKIQLLQFAPVTITSWDANPYHSRSWQLYLHGLTVLPCLVDAYERTKNAAYLDDARRLAISWILAHPKYTRRDKKSLAWHDHALAFRISALLDLWETLRGAGVNLAPEDIKIIAQSLDYQISLMLSPARLNIRHNHGYFQGKAALLASRLLDFDPNAKAWQRQATAVIIDYFDYAFTREGIHKEHSASYHETMMQATQEATQLLKLKGQADSDLALSPLKLTLELTKMGDFYQHLHTATGSLVPYGDTGFNPTRANLQPFSFNHRLNVNRVWPDSGYASFRNGWLSPEKTVHLFFTNALFGRIHKHADNLGFHLSAFGRHWIIDGGFKDYNKNVDREHSLSALAHSTIVVNEATPKIPRRPQPGDVSTQALREGWPGVVATHRLYPDKTIKRQIQFDGKQAFLLTDSVETEPSWFGTNQLKSKRAPVIDLLFQVMPDLNIICLPNTVIIRSPKKLSIQNQQELVIQVSPPAGQAPVMPQIIQGQNKPYRLGWFYSQRKALPLQTVRFRFQLETLPPTTTSVYFRNVKSKQANPLLDIRLNQRNDSHPNRISSGNR